MPSVVALLEQRELALALDRAAVSALLPRTLDKRDSTEWRHGSS
jgi:hypothetical protein